MENDSIKIIFSIVTVYLKPDELSYWLNPQELNKWEMFKEMFQPI